MGDEKILELFGKLVMENVRDEAILFSENMIDGNPVIHRVLNYHKEFSDFPEDEREKIKDLCAEIVTGTIALFIDQFKYQENPQIIYSLENKGSVSLNEVSDGLVGELYKNNGWIARYSRKRNSRR